MRGSMAVHELPGSRRRGRSPRRMAPEERRRQLLDAAIGLYGKHTYDEVSVDDITVAADVSRALFYRYFSSPADIYQAAMHQAIDSVLSQITARVEGSLADQLRQSLRAILDYAEAHPNGGVVLLKHGLSDSTSETGQHFDDARLKIVEFLFERGDVSERTPLMDMTVRAWINVVMVAIVDWLQEPKITRADLEEWLFNQFMAMSAATGIQDPVSAAVMERLSGEFFPD
ncbi:TetR/AcrR family transcriptional regulator [Pseudonocardiaceae bacterium YIM PH 21723]|nr:TetR/AcrR family transcriptional regulator [Pseudonocardiaceae bacterium YIM PH 21723]